MLYDLKKVATDYKPCIDRAKRRTIDSTRPFGFSSACEFGCLCVTKVQPHLLAACLKMLSKMYLAQR